MKNIFEIAKKFSGIIKKADEDTPRLTSARILAARLLKSMLQGSQETYLVNIIKTRLKNTSMENL